MAQVDTHSAFRHSSSQHQNYYYPPNTATTTSGSTSSNSSHHSSPRSASQLPQQRYYSPPQCYSPPEERTYHSPYRETYSSATHNSSAHAQESIDSSLENPAFPAYHHAMSSTRPNPDIDMQPTEEDDEEEDDYDEPDSPPELDSPSSLKSASPSTQFPIINDDIWTERGPAPSRQVDYLSHDWQEPDIWSSWRYVRKERHGYPQNAARLENASWRTWAKSKYKLKTITPETLNWLKDCDVTWLYGPLQSQGGTLARAHTEPTSPATSEGDHHGHPSSQKMSRSSSFSSVPSKPILKKRSHSEVMLTSFAKGAPANLLTRAAAQVQADRRREIEEAEQAELREEQRKHPLTPTHILRSQQRSRRKGSMDLSSFSRGELESPFNLASSGSNGSGKNVGTDYFGPVWSHPTGVVTGSSGGQTPSATPSASKHIHFNDRVEQCIAVDVKEDEEDSTAIEDDSEEEEDSIFLMRGSKPHSQSSGSPHFGSGPHKPELVHSTIAKLPATSLRPADEPIREPPSLTSSAGGFFGLGSRRSNSQEDLSQTANPAGFYYDEGTGFSASASPPEFPLTPPPTSTAVFGQQKLVIDEDDPMDDFSFDHPFASQSINETVLSNQSSGNSSRRSSEIDLETESARRASVGAIPIPTNRAIARDRGGLMGEDEDEEGIGIVGLAADAISTAKDLVGVLWNAGWGTRRQT